MTLKAQDFNKNKLPFPQIVLLESIFLSILQFCVNVFSLKTILQNFGLILYIEPRYFINFRFDFIRCNKVSYKLIAGISFTYA